LFQPKPDILRAVEPSTTTAGGDLKQPDKQELASTRNTGGVAGKIYKRGILANALFYSLHA
jgi:hypothetical protein